MFSAVFQTRCSSPSISAVNVFALDERHLDVNLRELRLAVGAQVLVAVTARELEIFFHAGHHEDLLELLRRLRQRVEQAGVRAARHEKFPRAFRRGFEERGRLHFQKSLFIHEHARGGGHLAAQAEVARHLGPAQIQIAIFQPQFLVHLARHFRVVHRKRQHLGHVEHFQFLSASTSTSPVGIFGLFVPADAGGPCR